MPPAGTAVLAQSSPKRIDWKLAAKLRANGNTWEYIAGVTGASSGDAVRQCLARRGVVTAIRTVIERTASEQAVESMKDASNATKLTLSQTVLEQSEALAKVKAQPNLRNIKKIADCIEPLVRSAERIHGWNNQGPKSLVNVQVLSNLNVDDLPDSGSDPIQVQASVQQAEEKEIPLEAGQSTQVTDGQPL